MVRTSPTLLKCSIKAFNKFWHEAVNKALNKDLNKALHTPASQRKQRQCKNLCFVNKTPMKLSQSAKRGHSILRTNHI